MGPLGECEYCGAPATENHKNHHGRLEPVCGQCADDFRKGNELQRQCDLRSDVEEDTDPLPRPLEDR
jgi:hypothetical protein